MGQRQRKAPWVVSAAVVLLEQQQLVVLLQWMHDMFAFATNLNRETLILQGTL